MVEDKSEKPNEIVGPQQDIKKTYLDEIIESVEKISCEDLINNPKSAINLIIANLKEKSIENRELRNKIEKLLFENKEISNKLAVVIERLKAKEFLSKVINFISAGGGILVTLASTGKFKIGEKDLSWVLMLLGLILIFSGLVASLFEKSKGDSNGEKK